MKLKYYLRGLGIGIICTAIIMGIALSGNKKEMMTDTEIIERARLLGMVMPEEADSPPEPEEGQESTDNKASKPKAEENVDNQQSGSQPGSGNEPADDNQENNPSDEGASAGNGNQQAASQGTVQIEIKAGDYSDTVSRKLFQAGLISDADSFNKYLTQKGADQDLRVGVYQIPAGATQDQIIEILVAQPD